MGFIPFKGTVTTRTILSRLAVYSRFIPPDNSPGRRGVAGGVLCDAILIHASGRYVGRYHLSTELRIAGAFPHTTPDQMRPSQLGLLILNCRFLETDGTHCKIQVPRSAIPRGIVSADAILHPASFNRDVVSTTAGTLSRSAGNTQRKQSRQIQWFNWSRLWPPVVSKSPTMLHRSLPVSCSGIQGAVLHWRTAPFAL